MAVTILGGVEYPVEYNWEAIEGIQTELSEDSLSSLAQTIVAVLNNTGKITNKDMGLVMRTAKIIIYHGLRGAALSEDKPCPFKSPSHVGTRLSDFKEAGKQLGLFYAAMNQLFSADPDDAEPLGESKGEATPL